MIFKISHSINTLVVFVLEMIENILLWLRYVGRLFHDYGQLRTGDDRISEMLQTFFKERATHRCETTTETVETNSEVRKC